MPPFPHAFAPLNLPSTGHAVVCQDAAAFAEAVDDLLGAIVEASDMARRAKRSIEGQFSWRTHSQTLSELLIRICRAGICLRIANFAPTSSS